MSHHGTCLVLWFCILSSVSGGDIRFNFRTNASVNVLNDVELEVKHKSHFLLQANHDFGVKLNLTFLFEEDEKNNTNSKKISITVSEPSYSNNETTWQLVASGTERGHSTLVLSRIVVESTIKDNTTHYQFENAFIRFQIYYSKPLNDFSMVIGWIYFVAASLSLCPQVYLNWRRKSVVGLNFDYTGLNLLSFLCYTAYNVSLFWIPTVQKEFRAAHPHDMVPVELNDVIFAIDAAVFCFITVLQVLCYEKGNQKVSLVAWGIIMLCGFALLILIILAAVPTVTTFNWLNMVYAASYIKLGITVIKYMPQAWMNYTRRCTIGFSIGNVLLDLTGATGSVLQMLVLAYNFNDWPTLYLNPVKFGLGTLSIGFDLLFIVQHYCLYGGVEVKYSKQANE